jgi:hypothetical protein
MATTTEERLVTLEKRLADVEKRLQESATEKRGWRWFVGAFANSPDFDEVVQIGQEWRNADRPDSEETPTK